MEIVEPVTVNPSGGNTFEPEPEPVEPLAVVVELEGTAGNLYRRLCRMVGLQIGL